MRIALIEPYCTGSHAAWAREYARYSRFQVDLLTLPGRNWKWRMHGGAVSLAARFLALDPKPDLILATDMLDLTTFLALTRRATCRIPCAIYFHENQLTYPWSPGDPDPAGKRDLHYAFINYVSALAADLVLFNSAYHRRAFLEALPPFLKAFPDATEPATVAEIERKSRVLPLGVDLAGLDRFRVEEPKAEPLILWNHRWEYDKDPEAFFGALYRLADQGVGFRLAVLGESFGRVPAVFAQAKKRLGDRVVAWGYQESFDDYAGWLWRSDILPVTSRQEFFGASVVQAIYCGCTPLLPDRLSYPEHLPAETGSQYLYRESDSLVERVKTLIDGWDGGRKPPLASYVNRYDWRSLAPCYDEVLAGMLLTDESRTG